MGERKTNGWKGAIVEETAASIRHLPVPSIHVL